DVVAERHARVGKQVFRGVAVVEERTHTSTSSGKAGPAVGPGRGTPPGNSPEPDPEGPALTEALPKGILVAIKEPVPRTAGCGPCCWGFLGHAVHEGQRSGNRRRAGVVGGTSARPPARVGPRDSLKLHDSAADAMLFPAGRDRVAPSPNGPA